MSSTASTVAPTRGLIVNRNAVRMTWEKTSLMTFATIDMLCSSI